jgi:lipopolysaccharide transport system permease protein
MAWFIFEYRELIKNLVISDLKVKYASSVLGFAWSMLNPLLMMLVLYFVFSGFYKTQENFVLYIFIGLLVWRFFSIGTTISLGSIVGRANLVTKIFIPREILPLSSVLSSLISSVLEFCVLVPLLLIFGAGFHITIVLFPIVLALSFLIVFGCALILSSFYVYFRDMNQIWDVFMQMGFFATPIMYATTIIPDRYRFYYMLNPITRLMGMYRDIFLTGTIPTLADFVIVLASGLILTVVGIMIFKKLSRRFAEEV